MASPMARPASDGGWPGWGSPLKSRQLLDVADAAFTFEETLYDPELACWLDLRFAELLPAAT